MSNDPRATIKMATLGRSDTSFAAADIRLHVPLRRLVADQPKLFIFDDATGIYTLRESDEGKTAVVIRAMEAQAEPLPKPKAQERAPMMQQQADEDDEWIPLKKMTASGLKPDLVVSIKAKEGAKAGRAAVVFRGEAKRWLGDCLSVDIDVGGADLNKLRIRGYAKASDGQFVLSRTGRVGSDGKHSSSPRAQFAVDLWPNEDREREASFTIKHEGKASYLIATLPKNWAKPLGDIKDAPKTNSGGLPRVDPEKAGAAMRSVAGLPPQSHPTRSASTIPVAGEPPPGRSALDQRRAGK